MDDKGAKKQKKLRKKYRRLCLGGGIFLCLVLLLFFTYFLLKSMGRNSLIHHANEVADRGLSAKLNEIVQEDGENPLELKEGQILVNGEVYEYNEEIITFLCMGIDSHSGISQTKTPGKAGQADALILIVVNSKTEEINVINVNRDSMVDIELYDTLGIFIEEEKGQITLQYAYGDGREKSCQLMEKAVSDLFYGIPIHGYAALDIGAIATLNDAVGGVEVTATEDVVVYMPEWEVGSKVTLRGEEALYYVRHRAAESQELGTNIRRIERQKQFMAAFAEKVKVKMKDDISFPLTLYDQVQKNIVTSLSVDEMTYLANMVLNYDFSINNMIGTPGESKMGENSEEFHVDDAALKQIVIDVFYEKAE